jgi:hypothetical protein
MPPDSDGLVDTVFDQLQIGGGSMLLGGSGIPGLSIFGGVWWEGMPKPGGGIYPLDWRGIAFNHYENHLTGYSSRLAPMPWSGIGFSNQYGGMVDISCYPWHTGDSLTDNSGNVELQIQGNTGLIFWSDDRALGGGQFHHLFEVMRKGYDGGIGLRNDSGLFFIHCPTYIGGSVDVDFTNLANAKPDIGDDSTWMLAVNGPALVKELFVDDSDWPDYVLDPGYQLTPLGEVENYMKTNHHLPDIEPASKIAKTGVPVGRTEAALTKQLEETMLYVIQLKKQNDELSEKFDKLESDFQELKNKGEK